MKNTDRCMGIGLLALDGVLFANTFTFRITQWEKMGMAFWPRMLLIIMAGFAIYLVIKGDLEPERPTEPLAPKAFAAAIGGFAYVFLLDLVGFLLLTPVFIFFFSYWVSSRLRLLRVIESGVTALLGTAVVYVIFEMGLNLVLPSGLLGR